MKPDRAFQPRTLALFAAAAFLAVPVAEAANCIWNTTTGNWALPVDWSSCGGLAPGTNDFATIGGTGIVTVNTGQSAGALSNAGAVNIDAFTLTISGNANGGNSTNSGTITAGSALTGSLLIFSTALNNTGGSIVVNQAGSFLNLFNTTITGGTLKTTNGGLIQASNSASNFLSGVTLNGTIDLASATSIERVVNGLTLVSGSNINVNSNSVLNFEGTQTLAGTGTITLGATGASNRIGIDNTGVLTVGANILIHGQNGTIGQAIFVGGASTLNNGGTISADVSGGSINLVANTTNNTGTLSAANGGQLVLSGPVTNTGSGHIDATGTGSNVLQNGVTVTGGTINTSGGGVYVATNSGSNFLSGATLNGTIDLASATGIERVINGLTLTSGSNINVNSNSLLNFEGNQTLAGTGSITLGATGASNRIGIDNTGTLTVGSNVLIHGQNGTIGGAALVGGASTLINNGTIAADVSGGTINIAPSNGVTNNGTLQALNGGTLLLSSNVTGGVGSSINVGAASTIIQNGVTLSSVITNTGTGTFTATNSGNNFFNAVTFTGTLDLASATGIERVINGLTLNGAINVNSNSLLNFEGNQTLAGTGSITLGATGASNRIGIDNTGTLTVGANILIHGQNGTIGGAALVGGASTLINNGTIAADVSGGTINIDPSNGVTNNGTLQALNGGTLLLSSNVTGGTGSSINVGAGSTVIQNGVTLSSVIHNTGTGTFTATNSGSNFFNAVNFTGTLDLASATGIERVINGLTLNGAINVNSNSILNFEGNQTLAGTGTITLGATGAGNRIGVDNTGVLAVGANILIHGQNGTIGGAALVGGASTLNNGGTISADVSGGSITLVANITNNTGTLSAANGGQLVLSGPVTNTGSGHIDATGAGSNVLQNGVTVTGGTINTSGGGVYTATNSGSNFLSGATLNGTIDLASATGIERVVNGLTLMSGSNINVNSNSILNFEGNQTLAGTGTITLGAAGGSNRIGIDNTGILNVGANVLIHGQNGTIGAAALVGGASTLNNGGTISADVAGGLITIAANTVTNNGTLRANGGSLTVTNGFTGTGTARIDGAGVLTVGASSTVGTLTNNGSAANALTLGANNITVSSSYTNANFGTGNTFNNHANVSGTGQILAAGDVAQAITGTTVTNGTTATPTLTIGNVHVGANTFNYQVANAGTTGPSLIGAIQTSVNGGNVTDSRLSGAGVTASNYGPVATGTNSGSLGVTFTAATAGALAPLAGQAVHIANNFDNVAGQTMSIVVGSGAGAYNLAAGNATPSPATVANQRIGGSNTTALTVANTAPSGSFTEVLNASFGTNTGMAINNGGTITGGLGAGGVAGGSSNNTAMSVGVNTTAAGARTGTVTLNYVSNGTGTSGLGNTALTPAQTINVSGNVYQAAAGAIQTAALNFGTVQVNQSVSQNLVIRNTATGPNGFVEDLNAAFGTSTDARIIGTGSLNGILAGSNSTGANGTMNVSINTSAVGIVNGSIRVNYTTTGAVGGISNGLGTLGVGGEDYAAMGTIVQGNVVDQAKPVINGVANPGAVSVNLGNVRINTAANQTLTVQNQATSNPQAALNASIASNGAPITASGSFNQLLPGNSSPGQAGIGTLQVGVSAAAPAGHVMGSATVSLVSDASNIGNCSPNCAMNLPSQTVNVAADVYRLANPVVNTASPVNLAGRVGGVGDSTHLTSAISISNSSPDQFTEGLNVARGTTPAGFASSGSITNLSAQGTSSAISVSLNTAAAGHVGGTQVLQFASNGTITGNSDLALANGGITLSGDVYTPAVAQVTSTTPVNFGIVHVGDAAPTASVTVKNNAAVSALNDTLQMAFSSAGAPFGGSGNLVNLGAQQSDSSALTVNMSTATAGVYSGQATFSASSHDSELADLALANVNVALMGQVNNYALAAFREDSGGGAFSGGGSSYTLDFGNLTQNSGHRLANLGVFNNVLGPADVMAGAFNFLDPQDFGESGFTAFSGLAAAAGYDGLNIDFNTAVLGTFQDQIRLTWSGSNASGYQGPDQFIVLTLRANVVSVGAVPEPNTFALMLLCLSALAFCASRRFHPWRR